MTFRLTVIRSGIQLIARYAAGITIGFVGVVMLSSILGASTYGIYAALLALHSFFYVLLNLGIKIYLVRSPGNLEAEDYHQAFTLLSGLGFIGLAIILPILPFLEEWMKVEAFSAYAIALFASLPIELVLLVPMAQLERALNFSQIAAIEIFGQLLLYFVAVPLAYYGLGVWAPIIGWWCKDLFSIVAIFRISNYRPRIYWEHHRLKRTLYYGVTYSLSSWIWEVRNLVIPLLVTHYAGTAAVAYINLATKFAQSISIARDPAWRLSISVLGRIQSHPRHLARAIAEGMQLSLIAVGPPLFLFAVLGRWLMSWVYEPHWLVVMDVFPFIALGFLIGTFFNLHNATLSVLGHNWLVAAFQTVFVGLFVASAVILVPSLGIIGYGWSEVCALPGYVLMCWFVHRNVGRIEYRVAAFWVVTLAVALFYSYLGFVAILPLVAIFLWPKSRRTLLRATAEILGLLKGRWKSRES
jgi:PST family polysaccharide transporter